MSVDRQTETLAYFTPDWLTRSEAGVPYRLRSACADLVAKRLLDRKPAPRGASGNPFLYRLAERSAP